MSKFDQTKEGRIKPENLQPKNIKNVDADFIKNQVAKAKELVVKSFLKPKKIEAVRNRIEAEEEPPVITLEYWNQNYIGPRFEELTELETNPDRKIVSCDIYGQLSEEDVKEGHFTESYIDIIKTFGVGIAVSTEVQEGKHTSEDLDERKYPHSREDVVGYKTAFGINPIIVFINTRDRNLVKRIHNEMVEALNAEVNGDKKAVKSFFDKYKGVKSPEDPNRELIR